LEQEKGVEHVVIGHVMLYITTNATSDNEEDYR